MTKHITPKWKSLLDEFELDWRLSGLAPKTATEYVRHLYGFLTLFPEPTGMNAKQWLEQCPTAPSGRYKARALRRFAKWLDARGDHCASDSGAANTNSQFCGHYSFCGHAPLALLAVMHDVSANFAPHFAPSPPS